MFRKYSLFVNAKYVSLVAVCLLIIAADYTSAQTQDIPRNNRIDTSFEKLNPLARLSYVPLKGSDDVATQVWLSASSNFD